MKREWKANGERIVAGNLLIDIVNSFMGVKK